MEIESDLLEDVAQFNSKIFDNLFDADHRNKMIRKYGYTGAMNLTIEALTEDGTYSYELSLEEFFDNEGGEIQ
jgi:hypothetical protein